MGDDSKSNEVDASALDMKTSGVEEKKGKSTKYNLDFVDDEARTKGNNQQAAKWLEISTNGSQTRRNKHRLLILSKRIRKKKKLLILIDGIERLKDNDTHFFIHFSIKYFEFLFFFFYAYLI